MSKEEQERKKAHEFFFHQENKLESNEKRINKLIQERNDLVLKNDEWRKLGEDLALKIPRKEEENFCLDEVLAELKQKKSCLNKKIKKAEKLICHMTTRDKKLSSEKSGN